MKAKDTARHQDNCELSHIKINFGKCTCGAEQQAEISFKAGRKQVVDWINEADIIDDFCLEEWQSQLKEWGIKED